MKRVYLDWAATAIPDTVRIQTAYNASQELWANPSSIHIEGKKASSVLKNTRERCATILGVSAESLVFCSGASEANMLILYSLLTRESKPALITTATEHPSIMKNAEMLKRLGFPVYNVAVDELGCIDLVALETLLHTYPSIRMAVFTAVNNETGVIQDIKSVTKIIRDFSQKKGPYIHIHLDMVQAIGKIQLQEELQIVDSWTISSHKLGGLKGSGLLCVNRKIESLFKGGGQESGLRSGTENLLGAISLTHVLEDRCTQSSIENNLIVARERLEMLNAFVHSQKRVHLIPNSRENNQEIFSPYITSFALDGMPAEVLVRFLDERGIAISAGSACSGKSSIREGLSAMGVSKTDAMNSVRISQGWTSTAADFNYLIEELGKIL